MKKPKKYSSCPNCKRKMEKSLVIPMYRCNSCKKVFCMDCSSGTTIGIERICPHCGSEAQHEIIEQ